jgi:hypothetical protein
MSLGFNIFVYHRYNINKFKKIIHRYTLPGYIEQDKVVTEYYTEKVSSSYLYQNVSLILSLQNFSV